MKVSHSPLEKFERFLQMYIAIHLGYFFLCDVSGGVIEDERLCQRIDELIKLLLLTGTDDIRAPEHTHRPRSIFRSDYPELSATWPFGKSIFENPLHAADRINVPGYR